MSNGQRYSLRNIEKDDLSTIFIWRNSEAIRQMMKNNELIKWENHIKWYESLYLSGTKIFKIFSVDNVGCGTITFQDITQKDTYWGLYMGGSKEQNKGLATIMTYFAINYVFDHYLVGNIIGEIFSFNEASKKFNEKMGFELTETRKNEVKKANTTYDLLIYTLSREKWLEYKVKFSYILDYHCEVR